MRISDWSSDVCSSDLQNVHTLSDGCFVEGALLVAEQRLQARQPVFHDFGRDLSRHVGGRSAGTRRVFEGIGLGVVHRPHDLQRSEEHTSELQSLMRISYAVFCLK